MCSNSPARRRCSTPPSSAHQRATYVLCQLFDPALVLTAAQNHGADLLAGVPTMLIAMVSHPEFDRFDLSRVLSGGSPIPPELVHRVEQRFGVQFTAVYGPAALLAAITLWATTSIVAVVLVVLLGRFDAADRFR